jgi:CheY-like chemotaxis protein/anti-sigma regulatory factor (Ser/Thr protein kinase)
VKDAIDMSQPLINAANHQLTVRLPDSPVELHIDRHRIAQVLSNLVNNAAKYTPPNGQISLEANCQNGKLAITVMDNGIGIDAELLPLVFELYAQAPTGEGMAQGGLGVGLNLVRRLVEMHDGEVSAESAGAGQGSRFTIRLPLMQPSDLVATPLLLVASAQPVAAATTTRALKILVVDDNVDAADILATLLEFGGHDVSMVHDAASALSSTAASLPEVVFLDIGLPDMSGYEVAPMLRNLPGMAGATLIALTGWGSESDKARSVVAGFDHHLTKPVEFTAVEALLDGIAVQR